MPEPDNDDALTPDFLMKLRRAAQGVISPWPESASVDDLPPARAKAVRAATREVVLLVRSLGGDGAPGEGNTAAPRRRGRQTHSPTEDRARVTPELEQQVGVTHRELTHLFILDALKGFGPQKFKLLYDHHLDAEAVVRTPDLLPLPGRTGEQLRQALVAVSDEDRDLADQRAARQLVAAADVRAKVLTYRHPRYPRQVLDSNNPIPVLYLRGDERVLTARSTVACVGSRLIREPYSVLQADFAAFAAKQGVVVVSGFALGADTVAHRAAVDVGGRTVCVMPSGLDRPFPPENKGLYEQFLDMPGVAFLSEFPFGTGAVGMTLRKRNKLIVAAAGGVLVGQSSRQGGAMNAFRFAIEQRKPVATFSPDGTEDTGGNKDILREVKVPTVGFPSRPAPAEWDAWLSQLS